jgi:DNA-binding NarL/FixJ family response regulator
MATRPTLQAIEVAPPGADLRTTRLSSAGGDEPVTRPRPTAVIADARPTSRLGICAVVEDAGFVVVAQVATAAEAVEAAIARRPDACVLDASMAGGGVEAARAIAARVPTTATLVLADVASTEDVLGALRAGAAGCLPRSIGAPRLRAALQTIAAGDVTMPRALVDALLRTDGRRRPRRRAARLVDRDVVLSSREWDVVALLRRGLSTQEISDELGISVVTVRRHLSTLRRKLGAPDRATALRLLEASGTFVDTP